MVAVFPFKFLRPGFREYLAFRTGVDELGGGRRIVQKLHAAGELVVRGVLLFPNEGGTYADFEAFWNQHFGPWGAWLYPAQDKGHGDAIDTFVGNGVLQDFSLLRRFIDVASIIVTKAGLPQTIAVHYTLQNESGGAYVLGTSTKLVVHFLAAPGNGLEIAVAHRFYYPMRFEGDDIPDEQDLIGGGVGAAAIADRRLAIAARGTGPGFEYATVPNAL